MQAFKRRIEPGLWARHGVEAVMLHVDHASMPVDNRWKQLKLQNPKP